MQGCSVADHRWTIRFGDQSRVRRKPAVLAFDVPIDVGGELLTLPENANDLRTVQTILRLSFDRFYGVSFSEDGLTSLYGSLLNLVRWRRDCGLARFSDLDAHWFAKFVQQLRAGGVPSVLSLESKTIALAARIDAGEIVVPLTKDGRGAAMDELSRAIGLNRRNQIPNRLWQPVLDAARRQHPHIRNPDLEMVPSELGTESVRSALQTWELMWTYREWLSHDPLCFEPIAYPQTIESIATSIAPRVKNTRPVPPAFETCRLINEALAIILEQKSSVIEFHRGLKTRLRPIGGKSVLNYAKRRSVLEGLIGEAGPDSAVVR